MLSGNKFILCAFVTHIGGGIASGHYLAYVKKGNTWNEFDDEKSRDVAENDQIFKDNLHQAYYFMFIREQSDDSVRVNDEGNGIIAPEHETVRHIVHRKKERSYGAVNQMQRQIVNKILGKRNIGRRKSQ